MLVSLIITTKNEERVLKDLFTSIKSQTYKKTEILLVDNNSTDRTKEIAISFGARVFNKGPERSTQRNFGVKKANGKCVMILDADMMLTKKVIEDAVEKSKKFKAIIIPERSFGTGFWVKFKIFEREFYEGDDLVEAARFFDRATFIKFGGYDTRITGPEDFDLPLRIREKGIKIGRIKSYILHNEKRFSPIGSAKKKYYYALKAGPYFNKHPKVALKQGNLLLKPIYFRKWKKLVAHPFLSMGMFLVRGVEMTGALLGAMKAGLIKTVFSSIIIKMSDIKNR